MKRKKVLFATSNPAKVKKYAEKLKLKNIELLTLKDIDVNVKIEENGKNNIESLRKKSFYVITVKKL